MLRIYQTEEMIKKQRQRQNELYAKIRELEAILASQIALIKSIKRPAKKIGAKKCKK